MSADAPPTAARNAGPPVTSVRSHGRGWRPWPGSLRGRLIASHALTLLLAMVLVVVMSAGFSRRQEGLAQAEQLRDLAVPVTVETGFLVRRVGLALPAGQRLVEEALGNQAAALGVRIFVLDGDGQVQFDTGGTGANRELIVGQRLNAYAEPRARLIQSAEGEDPASITRLLAVPVAGVADPLAGTRVVLATDGRQPEVVVGLAVAPRRWPLARHFHRPLLLVIGLSLAVAVAAGSWSSRRIAAPVSRLTAAADAMAGGALEQRIPDEATDEIGRLVTSFNAMSAQVAATSRSQRRLLANVAHELRTPLTTVRGFAQAMRDGVATDPEERTRAAGAIVAESERMGRLVSDLLDLSRLESGQVALRFDPVNVGAALAATVARFAPEAVARGVRLAVTLDERDAGLAVRADDERLAQILGNLVDNAVRQTPSGGEVVLTGERLPGVDGVAPMIRLRVRDTGLGISPEEADRIFDRFTRGQAAAGLGFGLGLAIVRELVVAHGGTITLTSEVGLGTSFLVDLPATAGGDD